MPEPEVRESETSDAERDNRNLADLLQELRVAGLGVQMLFGFLLALPFTVRFAQLDGVQRVLYRGPGHGNFVVQGDLLSADPSGRHLLMNVLTVYSGGPMVFGRLDNGRFTKLPGPAGELASLPAAW